MTCQQTMNYGRHCLKTNECQEYCTRIDVVQTWLRELEHINYKNMIIHGTKLSPRYFNMNWSISNIVGIPKIYDWMHKKRVMDCIRSDSAIVLDIQIRFTNDLDVIPGQKVQLFIEDFKQSWPSNDWYVHTPRFLSRTVLQTTI